MRGVLGWSNFITVANGWKDSRNRDRDMGCGPWLHLHRPDRIWVDSDARSKSNG